MKNQFMMWILKSNIDGSIRLTKGEGGKWELFETTHHAMVYKIENNLVNCVPVPVLVIADDNPST